jgi:aspartyl-tRNA(Asn)/glutamyl-tRNA(Gln) amidotransferase subunit C
MALSESEVRHVALLARLSLTDEEIETLRGELNSVLSHIDAIQQLDLSDVEPTAHAVPVVNRMRADVVKAGLDRETALMNAPESEKGAFVIPRIVGPGGEGS